MGKIKEKIYVFNAEAKAFFKKGSITRQEAKKRVIEFSLENGNIPARIRFEEERKTLVAIYLLATGVGEKEAREIGYKELGPAMHKIRFGDVIPADFKY